MSKAKMKPADMKAAQSWKNKPIRDTQVNQIGIVVDIIEEDEQPRLVAHFPDGTPQKRIIALEPRDDLECLVPNFIKARYRPPRPEDLERLKKRASSS